MSCTGCVVEQIGHGSTNQVKDVAEAAEDLEDLSEKLNQMHGHKKWAIVYGECCHTAATLVVVPIR